MRLLTSIRLPIDTMRCIEQQHSKTNQLFELFPIFQIVSFMHSFYSLIIELFCASHKAHFLYFYFFFFVFKWINTKEFFPNSFVKLFDYVVSKFAFNQFEYISCTPENKSVYLLWHHIHSIFFIMKLWWIFHVNIRTTQILHQYQWTNEKKSAHTHTRWVYIRMKRNEY